MDELERHTQSHGSYCENWERAEDLERRLASDFCYCYDLKAKVR